MPTSLWPGHRLYTHTGRGLNSRVFIMYFYLCLISIAVQ
jgi:hypothetical protein